MVKNLQKNGDKLFSNEFLQSIADLKTLTNFFISQKLFPLSPIGWAEHPNAPPAYNGITFGV